MRRAFLHPLSLSTILSGILDHLVGVYGDYMPAHLSKTFYDVIECNNMLLNTWLFLLFLEHERSVQDMVRYTQEDNGVKLKLYLPFLSSQALVMRNAAFEEYNITGVFEPYVECCREVWLSNDQHVMNAHQILLDENRDGTKPKKKKKKPSAKRAGVKKRVKK